MVLRKRTRRRGRNFLYEQLRWKIERDRLRDLGEDTAIQGEGKWGELTTCVGDAEHFSNGGDRVTDAMKVLSLLAAVSQRRNSRLTAHQALRRRTWIFSLKDIRSAENGSVNHTTSNVV